MTVSHTKAPGHPKKVILEIQQQLLYLKYLIVLFWQCCDQDQREVTHIGNYSGERTRHQGKELAIKGGDWVK